MTEKIENWQDANERRLNSALLAENKVMRNILERIIANPRQGKYLAYEVLHDCDAIRISAREMAGVR